MTEKNSEILLQILEKYNQIEGRKILEALKKYEFRDNEETFQKACLLGAVEYLERKKEKLSEEEFLALLIRLSMMYFVEKKHHTEMWYILLSALLPKEIQMARMSEVVKRLEEQFIEFMRTIAQTRGDEGIKDAVLIFLFKENAEFTLPMLATVEENANQISRMLH